MGKKSKFINKKQFKYGGYALAMTVGVIVAVLVVNFLLISLDNRYNLSIDMTANKVYSLTNQTERTLDELDSDVYIYTIFGEGSQDQTVVELLDRYSARSKYIHVENIDVVSSPGRVQFYQNEKDLTIYSGSVIVSNSADTNDSQQTFKIISPYDMYSYDSETESYSLFIGEDAITGAMLYIKDPNIPKVWFLEGHGTTSTYWTEMVAYLEQENYDTGGINLTTEKDNLEKGDILIVMAPSTDLNEDERETMLEFALDGGKIFFMFDPKLSVDIPNFMLILSHYNISMEDGRVAEQPGSTTYYYSYSSYLVPDMNRHDMTTPLIADNLSLIMPDAGSIDIGPSLSGIEVEVIAESSERAFLEPLNSEMDGELDDGEEVGKFTVMVAATKAETDTTAEAQIIVSSSASMFVSFSNLPGNLELFLNAVSWMSPIEDNFYIRGKSLKSSVLYFSSMTDIYVIIAIVLVVVPLAAFAGAIVVYLKRRHL